MIKNAEIIIVVRLRP